MGGAAVLRFVIRNMDPDGKSLRILFNEDPNSFSHNYMLAPPLSWQSDTSWWKGTCKGRTGLIPSNYGKYQLHCEPPVYRMTMPTRHAQAQLIAYENSL